MRNATSMTVPSLADRPSTGPGRPGWRRRLFWKLQGAGWGGAALLAIVFSSVGYFHWHDALLLGLFRTLLGFLISCGLRFCYRPAIGGRWSLWAQGLAVFLLCGLAGLADGVVSHSLAYLIGVDMKLAGAEQFMVGSVFMRWMLYWLWSLLYFGINYWLDTEEARVRLAQVEAAMRSSELQVLRAQVNPHFLFNALNSILAESESPGSVRSLTLALSEYLRFSLQQRGERQPLGVELEALEHYLCVEKARFEEKLEYAIEADAAARSTLAPVALVQPLLDNAIKYGQRSLIRPLRITIRAALVGEVEGKMLCLAVVNTGEWQAPGHGALTGAGLANLRRRLQLLYGERAMLTTEAGQGEVRVHVRLPLIREPRETEMDTTEMPQTITMPPFTPMPTPTAAVGVKAGEGGLR